MVLSKEVRKALKFACSRKPSPDPALTTKSTLTSVREPGLREVEGGRERQEAQGACSLSFGPTFLPSLHPFLGRREGSSHGMCSLGRRRHGGEEEDLTWERWVWSMETEGEDVAKTSHE